LLIAANPNSVDEVTSILKKANCCYQPIGKLIDDSASSATIEVSF
jgi:selenophosphate synthase